MKLIRKIFWTIAALSSLATFNANADLIVTWEDNDGDLVIHWDGFIDNWVHTSNFDTELVILQTGNGMHALSGNVDLIWTGTTHNWFTGPSLSNGILFGDSFGSSGLSNWVYMPGDYAGEVISGSATFLGAGNNVGLGNFTAGSRDLGFGDNDNIIFQAFEVSTVPEPSTLVIFSIGLLGLARRFGK